jgi:hypothetical protein
VTHETAASLASASDRGLQFLLRSRADSGTWKDFLLPAGQSDIWVTGYVASALADLDDPAARGAAQAAWSRLQELPGAGGGWSYNAAVPGDGDSTLWCLRLAARLDRGDSAVARTAARFLDSHVRDDGGLATYATADDIRRYVGLPADFPLDGWLQSHVCVTAAGAHLSDYRPRLLPYLERRQEPPGHWRSYWWFSDEYATCEAVTALAEDTASDQQRERVGRAAEWARERVARLCASEDKRPPAFSLALALRVVLRGPRSSSSDQAVALGLQRLLEWQAPTGAWPSSARLRVPRPDAVEPPGQRAENGQPGWRIWRGLPPGPPTPEIVLEYTFSNYSLDYTAVFTTATVLRALHDLARAR